MIDFQNATFVKLKKISNSKIDDDLKMLLIPGERLIRVYSSIRDFVVFTDKRFIACNVKGLTGRKKDFTSMPYNKISVFSIETAGTFDFDCELEMYFSGVGNVTFEFSDSSDILEIGRIISEYTLGNAN